MRPLRLNLPRPDIGIAALPRLARTIALGLPLGLTLGLAGCGTQVLETGVADPVVRDCQAPADLFENFRIEIKKAAWTTRDKTATLELTLEFTNSTPLPHALSNSGDGYVFAVDAALLSDKGASIAAKEATGALFGGGIHQPISPGIPLPATLTFEAQRAPYTLVITRKPTGAAAPGDVRDRAIVCKVPT